jgi:steroid delta-isomerase-like uncharacterized protein
MSSKENMKLVQKLYDCFNKNDIQQLNCLDNLLAQNVRFHDAATPTLTSGVQAVKQAESGYIKAFPNKSAKIDTMFGAEDRVVVRWTVSATHKGPFQGIAPTNKSFKISGITIYRVSDNKISEVWQSWDHLGLLEQLGVFHLQPAMR